MKMLPNMKSMHRSSVLTAIVIIGVGQNAWAVPSQQDIDKVLEYGRDALNILSVERDPKKRADELQILSKELSLANINLSGYRVSITSRPFILPYANLTKANLSDASLGGNDFSYANFSNATLTNASLTGAKLIGANFTNATLTNADLKGVLFENVNLTGANLTGANLQGANLSTANLTDATLTNATYNSQPIDNSRPGSTAYIAPTRPTQFPNGFNPQQRGMKDISAQKKPSQPGNQPDATTVKKISVLQKIQQKIKNKIKQHKA